MALPMLVAEEGGTHKPSKNLRLKLDVRATTAYGPCRTHGARLDSLLLGKEPMQLSSRRQFRT